MVKALETYGNMKYAYTDMGSEFTKDFTETLRRSLVKQITSRTPPAFVERLIRTVKNGIRERQEALPGTPWWRLLDPVIKQYNSEKQTTTKETPSGVSKLTWKDDADGTKEVRETVKTRRTSIENAQWLTPGTKLNFIEDLATLLRRKKAFNIGANVHILW